jgi:iron complex outermembrane receptor protein
MRLKTSPLLVSALSLAFGAPALAQTVAADAADAPQAVVVTGSRIARAGIEGPSPVTVITGDEITKQGYRNVFDALSNQVQNSGFTQGADFGNTFTPSANAISLRGLGPNHTLILLNGRRLADFPTAYDGTVNFTNLANIPSSIVERIEILSGGASAVYGSDAIAGVVNIILKKQYQGVDVDLKAGGTSRGGGGDKRLQITGGANAGDLNTLFSIEVSHRDPLWSNDRDFMSVRDGTPTTVAARKNVSAGGTYVDLGNGCAGLGDLFGGSTIAYAAKKGTYCASPRVTPTYWTTQTKNNSENVFGSANYALTPETTLFGELLVGSNRTANNTRGPSWTSDSLNNGYFLNQNTGNYETWTRYMAPEEYGGVDRYDRNWKDLATSVSFGAKGRIPGTAWDYEASYAGSFYQSRSHTPRALSNIDSFFLGPKLGVDGSGVAIYAPDPARLTQRLTPAEFDSITGIANSNDRSWTNTVSLITNGEAVQLPAGPLKLATVAEIGRQGFSDSPDARYNQGYFNTSANADVTAGTRSRYALGIEANIPILASVTGTLATRYDRYSFAGRHDGKLTYNAGLEWRPARQLLLRADYATSFRAPDMNYIYQSRGTGYYSSSTDYYRCAQAGQAIENCDYANVSPGVNYVQTGSKDLQSEKGKSFGFGAVWSPSADFDVSLDYWNIRIDNLVVNLDADKLLRDEADCRTGRTDISSPSCVDTLSRVQRYPLTALSQPGEIRQILVNPINAAFQSSGGIDLSTRYALRTAAYGAFVFKAAYSKTLSAKSRQFAADPTRNDLDDLSNQDWRDKLNASVNWTIKDWSTTLFLQRYGKVPNAEQTAYLSPTTLVNVSTVYNVNKRTTVTLAINNLFNKVKMDPTAGWPYYPVGNYSPIGRQGWLELNYHFGS